MPASYRLTVSSKHHLVVDMNDHSEADLDVKLCENILLGREI